MITGEIMSILDQCNVRLSYSPETSNEASCHSSARGQAVSPCFCVGVLAQRVSFCKWPCTACKDSTPLSFGGLLFICGRHKLMAFECACVNLLGVICYHRHHLHQELSFSVQYVAPSARRMFGRCGRNDNELREIFFQDPFGNL